MGRYAILGLEYVMAIGILLPRVCTMHRVTRYSQQCTWHCAPTRGPAPSPNRTCDPWCMETRLERRESRVKTSCSRVNATLHERPLRHRRLISAPRALPRSTASAAARLSAKVKGCFHDHGMDRGTCLLAKRFLLDGSIPLADCGVTVAVAPPSTSSSCQRDTRVAKRNRLSRAGATGRQRSQSGRWWHQ